MSESKKSKVCIVCADKVFARMLVLELADSGIAASIQQPASYSGEDGAVAVIDTDSINTTPIASSNTLYFGFREAPTEVAASYLQRPFAITELISRVGSIISSLHSEDASLQPTPTNCGTDSDMDNSIAGDINSIFTESRLSVNHPTAPSGLFFDAESNEFFFNGESLKLTETEQALLMVLYENRGEPVSREQLLSTVWGRNEVGQPIKTNLTDVYIRYLREKIDDRFNTRFIYSIRGKGYMIR